MNSTKLTREQQTLSIVLRCLGGFDALALAAVLLPMPWMDATAMALGLEAIPQHPLVGYLARSTSAMYALHGLTVLFVSFDVPRYRPLIRFLAAVAVCHGFVMFGIDLYEGMPLPWQIAEGPCFSATGLVILWLLRRDRSSLG